MKLEFHRGFELFKLLIQGIIDRNQVNLELGDNNVNFVSTRPTKCLESPKKSLPPNSMGGPLKMGHAHFWVKRNLDFS